MNRLRTPQFRAVIRCGTKRAPGGPVQSGWRVPKGGTNWQSTGLESSSNYIVELLVTTTDESDDLECAASVPNGQHSTISPGYKRHVYTMEGPYRRAFGIIF